MPLPPPDDAEVPRPPSSLAERLVQRARPRRTPEAEADARDWRLGAAIAVLIWAGPLAALLGAKLLEHAAEREMGALHAQLAPRVAAQHQAEAARLRLGDALRGPRPSAVAEALARTMPAEAKVARIAREPGGAIDLEISAPDPDRLRAALRRAPEFARMRDTNQRAGDGEIVSRFRIAAP